MALILALDSGPLGQLAHPDNRRYPDLNLWFEAHTRRTTAFFIPEISDFEVRRNLLLENRAQSLLKLDQLAEDATYAPITTESMRLAAQLWARARKNGRSVGDPKELNADVILAAQAMIAGAVIITDNVGHLEQFVEARPWRSITP